MYSKCVDTEPQTKRGDDQIELNTTGNIVITVTARSFSLLTMALLIRRVSGHEF